MEHHLHPCFLSQIPELQQDLCPHAGSLPGSTQVGVVVCCFLQLFMTSNDHTKSVKYLLVCFEGELPVICTNTVCSHVRILIIKLHLSVLAAEFWKIMTSIKCRQRPFPGCNRLFYCELASFFFNSYFMSSCCGFTSGLLFIRKVQQQTTVSQADIYKL